MRKENWACVSYSLLQLLLPGIEVVEVVFLVDPHTLPTFDFSLWLVHVDVFYLVVHLRLRHIHRSRYGQIVDLVDDQDW